MVKAHTEYECNVLGMGSASCLGTLKIGVNKLMVMFWIMTGGVNNLRRKLTGGWG